MTQDRATKQSKKLLPKWIDHSLESCFLLVFHYKLLREEEQPEIEKSPWGKKYIFEHHSRLKKVLRLIKSDQLKPIWESYYSSDKSFDDEDLLHDLIDKKNSVYDFNKNRLVTENLYGNEPYREYTIKSDQVWLASAIYSSIPTHSIIASKTNVASWEKSMKSTLEKLIGLFDEIPLEYIDSVHGKSDFIREFVYYFFEQTGIIETTEGEEKEEEKKYDYYWLFTHHCPAIFDTQSLLLSLREFYLKKEKNNFFWHPKNSQENYYFFRSLTHAFINRFREKTNFSHITEITNTLFNSNLDTTTIKKRSSDIIEKPHTFQNKLGLLTHQTPTQGHHSHRKGLPDIDPFEFDPTSNETKLSTPIQKK